MSRGLLKAVLAMAHWLMHLTVLLLVVMVMVIVIAAAHDIIMVMILMAMVHEIVGQRVCSCSSGSSSDSKQSRWLIFTTSGDVWTGLGIPAIAAAEIGSDGGNVMVFDCTATVTQRTWEGRAERGMKGWTWHFYPWYCHCCFYCYCAGGMISNLLVQSSSF
jgi:hypothetical protein